MGDRQLSPIDLSNLGKNISFYTSDQPQLAKALAVEDEARNMFASAVDRSTSAVVKQLSSSSSSKSPSFSSGIDLLHMEAIQAKADRSPSTEIMHLGDNVEQNKPELFQNTLQRPLLENGAAAETDLNSVITSLGLMNMGSSTSSAPSTTGGCVWSSSDSQYLGMQGTPCLNLQNLSPAVCQLLAAQTSLASRRRPATGHAYPQQQHQLLANQCLSSHQNSVLLNTLQPYHKWNGNLQSPRNNFIAPWGSNQQHKFNQHLSNNITDSFLLSKLQSQSLFPKNIQHPANVRLAKVDDSTDGLSQEQSNQDLDILKMTAVDTALIDLNGLSQSHDHSKAGQAWSLSSNPKNFHKEMSPFGFLDSIHLLENGSLDQVVPNLSTLSGASPNNLSPLRMEHFSRKVFVGGLPPDIDEEEITSAFRRFGPLIVDWPHKAESKSYFPPKGYCFLLFQDELSVQALIDSCISEDNKFFWIVSSPTMKDKMVQIRPWNLADSDFVMDGSQPLDPRKTIFVGGVPRPLRAIELAVIMERLYGGVCYAGIDTDPELKYPKGAGRVAFSSQQSYIAAISARFVQLQHGDIDKRVEVKPYVLDDQLCDECQGIHCAGRFAPFFCANVTCLQYYCEHCWSQIHSRPGREFHKPLVKEGADRPRSLPFRWC